jgi:HSP20 family protein
MTLMRFDPFRELDRLGERMLSGGPLRAMPTEAFRRGDDFYVLIDLPGVRTDDIQVTVERNVVNVQTERTSPRQDGDEVLVDERPHGRFSRQFFLGDNLDPAKLNATYELGVLTLTIPVAPESKPRQIKIASGEGDSAGGGARTVDVASGDQQPADDQQPAGDQQPAHA